MPSLQILGVLFLLFCCHQIEGCKKHPSCDKDGIGDCDFGSDICGNLGCIVSKLVECTDLDKLTQDEFYQLHRTYNTLCLGLRCDEEAAKACQTQAPVGTETNMLCWTMDCTIDAVEGCDQRTLESLSEAPGVTIEDMKDAYHQMCPSGN